MASWVHDLLLEKDLAKWTCRQGVGNASTCIPIAVCRIHADQ